MKILKASAGSGKTYRLSKTYRELLLSSGASDAYRHVLAVTFTNKATAEMKSRILDDLRKMSDSDPRARRMLVSILHDYGSFSISTIDRFFQQTLKAFSREIGQFADYRVELDRDSLIEETMDRILDSLTEDKEDLMEWIKAAVTESLEAGRKLRVEDGLYEIGKLLKSEEHRELAERYGIDDLNAFNKERLERIRTDCREIIADFEARSRALGCETEPGTMAKMPGKRALKASAELAELFDGPYRRYCTAFIVNALIFDLGLAGEFYKAFDALVKEKNVLCLDDSNMILRDVINCSDAPFIYEKTGVRYSHFLLDEFQDTSGIQWENIVPLLRESEANNGGSLVVGDVKQSIYRFRGSDWNLLGSRVLEEFPRAEVETLQGNWRSSRRVVAFNNHVFPEAAAILGLSDIYADMVQQPMKADPQEGFVKVSFLDDQMSAVLASVEEAVGAGAGYGDIAILVRGRSQGAEVADSLIGRGIPVISDDSLNLRSSTVVRRLVALLSSFENPDDKISRYLSDSMDVTFPEQYHSLVDLCEELLRSLERHDPESFAGQTLFIQAFMDDVQDWVGNNGNNLRNYLRHWDESSLAIGSPESASSVRIITIHKSKGLEFPYVIFPFADKVDLYRRGVHWCRLDVKAEGLPESMSGIYPVELSLKSANTAFAADYEEERRRQLVDNLNLFYVAMTRAGKGLHVIAATPSRKCRESVGKGKKEYGNMSELLYHILGGRDETFLGEMYDFSVLGRGESSEVRDFPASYASIPLSGRLVPSSDASDFFGEDGTVGAEASVRLKGIVLHDVLSRVKTLEDLAPALSEARAAGSLSADEHDEALGLLERRISAHPEWFPADGSPVLTERAVFGPDGREHRPDRVVFSPEGVTIIDFKFGKEKEEAYLAQLRRYAGLYESLGYRVSSAVIWYVLDDNCKKLF